MQPPRPASLLLRTFRCWLKVLILIFVGLELTTACFAQQSDKDGPAPTYWIVFDRVDTPEISFAAFPYIDIFVMDENGQHVRRLTSDHRSHNPAWSPDGQHIAFIRNKRMPVQLNTSSNGYDAIVAYRDFFTVPREVIRMDANGKNASRVASLNTRAEDVTWFPDGQRFGVRMSDRDALNAMVDKFGKFLPEDETTLSLRDFFTTSDPPSNYSSWLYRDLLVWVPPVDNFSATLVASPDNASGTHYYFPKSLPSHANLHASLRVVSLDGASSRFWIPAYDLAWSHDGKHIAYSTFTGEQKSILYTSNIHDGDAETNRHAVSNQSIDAHGPTWSPHNSHLSFTALWKDSSQIFIANADGTDLIQLSRDPKLSCFHPSWSPDAKWIVADCRENVTVMRPLTKEFGALSNIFLFDAINPGKKPRKLTSCAIEGPLPSPTCGARNPSFAPRSTASFATSPLEAKK